MSKSWAAKTVHSIDRWEESRRREPMSQAPKDSGNTARTFHLLSLYRRTGCLSDPTILNPESPDTSTHFPSTHTQLSITRPPRIVCIAINLTPFSIKKQGCLDTLLCTHPLLAKVGPEAFSNEWQQWQFWLGPGPCTLSSFLASTPTLGVRPLSRDAIPQGAHGGHARWVKCTFERNVQAG